MMFLLQLVCTGLLLMSLVVTSYLAFLALVRFVSLSFSRSAARPTSTASQHRFVIVIPAHNEEDAIRCTVESCIQLDYPRSSVQVVVIADNCSDRTAAIARDAGADCLERFDDANRGKGHALAWTLERIMHQQWDALLVVDADCMIDRHALRTIDAALSDGDRALQCNNAASNPDDGAISYALSLANVLENELFYAPKARLGLPSMLRGTGFVLHRDVLTSFPWRAGSVVEDAEYSAALLVNNIHIQYLPDASVRSPFPVTMEQLTIQRSRWVGGAASWARTHGLQCIVEGLRRRSVVLVDAGWSSFVSLRAPVLLLLTVTWGLAVLYAWLSADTYGKVLLGGATTAILMFGAYIGAGVLSLGISGRRLVLLGSLPLIAARHFIISMSAILAAPQRWMRTPRRVIPT